MATLYHRSDVNWQPRAAPRLRIALPAEAYYISFMKTFVVRLPEDLAADIEAESRIRKVSKSDVMRQWMQDGRVHRGPARGIEDIAHLFGSVVDDLPADLSARKKHYLRTFGYGRDRSR